MTRRQRKHGRKDERGGSRRGRQAPVPWRERAREVLRRLREYARDRAGEAIEEHLRQTFGDEAQSADVADLQRAFDDYVCAPGSADDGRSLVRAFAEASEELTEEERRQLGAWETDRFRRVYLLDRCHRDRLELWDPVAGGRAGLQLLERMPPARAAALRRGTVVIAVSVPWGHRRVALGQIEMYEDDEAIDLYRREVRGEGRTWHDMPPAAPVV